MITGKAYFCVNLQTQITMTKRTFFGILIAVVFAAVQVNAQDLDYYKQIVKELSSSKDQGRGYAKDDANKAGKYVAKEFA